MKEDTFGSTPAAQTLCKLVADKSNQRRRVSSILSEFSKTLWQLTGSKDRLVDLWYEECIKQVDKGKLDPEVRTFLKNVLHGRYKHWKKWSKNSRLIYMVYLRNNKYYNSGEIE